MTQLTFSHPGKHFRQLVMLAAVAALIAIGPSVLAEPDRFQIPIDHIPPKPQQVTSDLDATAPTPAEQHETRALAAAIFAKPAAAARAADKATAASEPDLNVVQAKPEWAARDGVLIGGKGLAFKSPF